MKQIEQNCLGFTIPVLVYESVAEADKAAGKEGAALAECNKNLVYRGALVTGREIITETVEKATGVKRETKPVMKKVKKKDEATGVETTVEEQAKDKEGNPLEEFVLDDADYIKFALEKSGTTREALQPAINDAASSYEYRSADGSTVLAKGLQVDIKETERKPRGPKTLPEKFKVAAEGAIKSGKVVQFAKDYKKLLGKEVPEDAMSDATKIGWLLKEFVAAKEAQTTGAYA